MGTPSLCTPAVAVGGGSSLCLQLLGAGSGRRWMWLHGHGGHLRREEGWIGGGGWAPAGRKAHHRLRCAHRQPLHPGCDGQVTGAAGWTPVCWALAMPVLTRSLFLPGSCPFPPAWAFRGGADPTVLRLPGRVTPGQQRAGSAPRSANLAIRSSTKFTLKGIKM